MQVKIIVEALLECLQLFPSTFKQIVSTNRQQGGKNKKDQVTLLFEDITKIFMLQNKQIAELSLKFLCNLFKARDKSQVNFREWVTRVLTNIILYLDAIKPRLFSESSEELNKPLPLNDVCFEFIFDREASEDRTDLHKLTIKDMRAQIQDFDHVQNKIEFLFKALQFTFEN